MYESFEDYKWKLEQVGEIVEEERVSYEFNPYRKMELKYEERREKP